MIFSKYPVDEIDKSWDAILKYLKENLPPTSLGIAVNTDEIRKSLLTEEMQMWIFANKEKAVIGFVITAFGMELGFKSKNFIIYAVVATSHINDNLWSSAISTLKQYAKKHECSTMIAYTKNPRVLEVAENLGVDIDNRLLVMEV